MRFPFSLCAVVTAFLLCCSGHVAACTVVCASGNGKAFMAANEDDYTGFARMWFNPATPTRFGSVCFGLPDLQAQAAMNEYGLAFDFTAQNIDVSKLHVKDPYNGDLFFEILGKCKTVAEALEYIKTHPYGSSSQVLMTDQTGESVVLNAGVVVRRSGGYQVNTNFDIANAPSHNYTCMRYDIADEILRTNANPDRAVLTDVLSRTHQEGNCPTLFSYIFDLKKGLVSVYFFHDYQKAYEFDLKAELKEGYHIEMISDHFPVSYAYESFIAPDPAAAKEKIMKAGRSIGFRTEIGKQLSLPAKTVREDSLLNLALLDVALQLIRDAWNERNNGAAWDYWFAFSTGYDLKPFTDDRLDLSIRILQQLENKKTFDIKYQRFICEMLGYLYGNKRDLKKSIAYYSVVAGKKEETFPISYTRATEMLKRLLIR